MGVCVAVRALSHLGTGFKQQGRSLGIRASILKPLLADHRRTEKATGLERGTLILRHALRKTLVHAVTVSGMRLSFLISGR